MAPLLEGITALNTNDNRRIYRPISGGGARQRGVSRKRKLA